MSETICKICGRSDCPTIGLSRDCRSIPDADRWTEPDEHGDVQCRHCEALEVARMDCAARAVDWFARCQELQAELDARESAWLVGAPHGSPSDCPCWYDKCLCTVENFAATIERAEQAESQLERLGAKKGCIGGCGFEDTWGVFERIVFDLDNELALLPPHDYTKGKPCFDPVDCADWHAGRIRTGVAQLQDHHAQALELLREALTIPNSGKTRTAITAFLAAEDAESR